MTYSELVNAVNTIILDAIHDIELQSAAFNVQLQKDSLLELLSFSVEDSNNGRVVSSSEFKQQLAKRRLESKSNQ